MKKVIVLYGLTLAVLIFVLKYLEYRLLVRDLSTEIYIGIIAVMFTTLGIWVGFRLTRKKIVVTNIAFAFNEAESQRLGIRQA